VLVVLGQIMLITACALALCVYVGWGAAALGLPAALRPFAAPLTPLVGYAIAIWAGYMGVSTALNLRWSLALLLALATALNLIAWRRGARPYRGAAWREHLPLLALFCLTLLAGILPLLHYGYLTAIGQGWDTESYLPMAQHLSDYPLAQIPEAQINPLRDLVRDPPRIGVTLGFSVFQAMTMLLSRQSALATFAPLLALLRALGILAIYIWLRATMGLGRAAALLGAAGAAAGALLLWVSYFNFGMQLAAWPLLALGLTLGIAAIDDLALPANDLRPTTYDLRPTATDKETRRPGDQETAKPQLNTQHSTLKTSPPSSKSSVALVAGVALAALPVAYYPALTIWIPLALGLGAARLIESFRRGADGPRPSRLLVAALALGVVALLLAALPIQDYSKGFSFRYSLPAQHIGPDRFISPTDTIGLTAFRLPDGGPQPAGALVVLAAAILAALAAAGLALPETTNDQRPTTNELSVRRSSFVVRRSSIRWLAVATAVLAYLGWLRFIRPYEYAYMKGSAYAGFVVWGLAACGWWALRSRARPAVRAPLAALALVPLLVAAWAQALTIADHWAAPAIFTRDIAAFDDAAAQVPAGAAVAISSDAAFTGPTSGLFSAMLYGREIWGHLSTAYTGLDYWPEGRAPQYALLAADERPWPLALGGQELWRSGAAALYRLPEGTQMLQGRGAFYSAAAPPDRGSPAALAIWRRGGAYRALSHDEPLTISVGDSIGFGAGRAQGAAREQQVRLTVASLIPQTVTLGWGSQSQRVALDAGVSQIALRLATPAELTIAPDERLALIEAVARAPEVAQDLTAQLDADQIAWSAAAEQRGATTNLRVDLANPGRHALRLGLTVIEDSFERPRQPLRVLAAAPIEGPWQLQFDLARGATQALVGKTPTPLLSLDAAQGAPDGTYFGMLTLYDGEEPVAHEPVFTLRVADGRVVAFDPVPFTIEATPVQGGVEPLASNQRALLADRRALDGGAAVLEGAQLQRRPPWPGAAGDAPLRVADVLTVRLGWRAARTAPQPLMVSLQVLGADDHKWAQWDGPLGGDWRPIQAWQAGERVRQDVPLRLDPATPPGSYRLLLVVYDSASGQPQPFGGQSALSLGELVVR
jgi:hypothetical protein